MPSTQEALQLVTASLGALGFSMIFNVRGRQLIFTTLGGLLSWLLYLLLRRAGVGDVEAYFLCGTAITIYAELLARIRRTPATVFLVSAAIPLVPGGSLYLTMVYAVHMDGGRFLSQGVYTLLLAGAIAAGIILVSTVVRASGMVKKG